MRAEEVARLRYAALPSSSGLFPTPLLEFALVKMRADLNDTLVHKTLHPPKIPRKSSGGVRSKQPRHQPLLLTAVAPPPWCCGRRSQPLPLSPPTGSEVEGVQG